jgi:glutathione S-transferase
MDWTLASLNPVFLAGFRDAKKPEAERAPDTGKNLAAELKILDGQLSKTPWIAGDTMSIADIALGPVVRRCVAFPFGLPPTPGIAAWLERLNAKASFRTATAAG